MSGITRRSAVAIGAAALASPRLGRAADPVKIGASLSLTGRFSDSAKYTQEGYLLWAEDVNAAGGLAGAPGRAHHL